MSTKSNEQYTKVRGMCNQLNFPDGKLTDEYMFTVDAVDVVFYKSNIGSIDIRNGFTDGKDDGGIDFVYTDGETLYLIQGKSSGSLSLEEIKNVYNKMAETVENFSKKEIDRYSEVLKSAYLNAYDALDDDKNMELVLFTNTVVDGTKRNDLNEFAKSESMSDYTISIFDKKDLELRRAIISQDSDLVEKDSVQLYMEDPSDDNNILHYGESGIVVNVKASSLKTLYIMYGQIGLFSYNLREFISSPAVDQGIDDTIEKDKDNFWFYNNGITIGCKDFQKSGNEILLSKFSVINGAQTTTKIGKNKDINENNDFAVVCKIVKAAEGVNQNTEFINKISAASNSQKPIRPRDLKANADEQRILQDRCANNREYCLAVEIKRGVHASNYKKVKPNWKRVTNEYIGQLIYACILQYPGPARNGKKHMFSNKTLYKEIYLRKHDYDTLYDLVRLGNIYKEYADEKGKETDDIEIITILENGKFTILACLLYMVKKKKNLVSNASSKAVHADNLGGLLISDYSGGKPDEKLYELFDYIVRLLKQLYTQYKTEKKITSYSNFFKTEANYELVLEGIDAIDDWDQKKLDDFLLVFTEKD